MLGSLSCAKRTPAWSRSCYQVGLALCNWSFTLSLSSTACSAQPHTLGQNHLLCCREGKRHGHGCYTFGSGDRYMGEYAEDVPHGAGVYLFASGQVYEGQWRAGRKHGWCVYSLANGQQWAGERAAAGSSLRRLPFVFFFWRNTPLFRGWCSSAGCRDNTKICIQLWPASLVVLVLLYPGSRVYCPSSFRLFGQNQVKI